MRIRVWLYIWLLLSLFWIGCGSGSSTSGSTGSSGPTSNASSGATFGKVFTMPAMALFNEAQVQAFRSIQAQLVNRGLNFNFENNLVIFPPTPASGWLVKVGDFETVTAFDGSFRLPAGASGSGFLIDPSGNTRTSFSLALLSNSEQTPRSLVIPQVFRGGCGMNEGDTDTFCIPRTNPKAAPDRETVLGRFEPNDWVQPAARTIPSYGVRRMARGTYPPPTAYIVHACPDHDGPYAGTTLSGLVDESAYFGSTCNFNVLDGACPNENPLSDQEYAQFAAHWGVDLFPNQGGLPGLFGTFRHYYQNLPFTPELLTPPSQVGLFDGNCFINHGGRMCGMFQLGDITLDAAGEITHPGETVVIKAAPNSTGSFVVHNNGVFGYTDINVVEGDGVTFSSPDSSNHDNHLMLRHFDLPSASNGAPVYQTDRTLNYRIAAGAQLNSQTKVTFTVDNRVVTAVFQIQGVTVTPASLNLFADGSQLFTAQHPDAGPGQTYSYEWSLAQATGTLTANAKSVTYRPKAGLGLPAQDELTVKVYVEENGSGRTLYGKASAPIRVEDRGALVTPSQLTLSPGESRGFSVQVQGQPQGSTLSYQWSSGNGLGSLAPADQANTVYTVNPNQAVSGIDAINVQVFVTDSAGQRLFAEGHAQVQVRVTSNNWAPQNNNSDSYRGLAFGADTFAALGFSSSGATFSLTSSDGNTFQPHVLADTFNTYNLRFLNGQFVAVVFKSTPTFHTEIVTSPDGANWTSRGPTGGVVASDVAYLNGLYVVAGDGGSFIAHTANLATSPDLSQWTSRGPQVALNSVKALGSRLVACGGGGVLLTSDNGIDWTQANSGTSATLSEAAFNGTRYVVVGQDKFLYSDDGASWASGTANTSHDNLFERVEYGNGRFRAVGRNFTASQVLVIYSSGDGVQWTPDVYPNISIFGDVDVTRVAFGNGIFLATTSRGDILKNP